tara:strand:- start:1001 stop:1243 length:243 start_codon:yes stop_codon:yes gene_type:complete
MDDSGDFSGDDPNAQEDCEVLGGPSAAMIAIMVVSMVCTMASAAKTLIANRSRPETPPYGTFEEPAVEMLDLRDPYNSRG